MAAQVRLVQPTDAAGILAIYGPYCESTSVSFEIIAPTVEQMRERITRIAADYPWLVAEIDGQIVGYVYATRHSDRAAYRWAVNVAVYVAAQIHRRGVGRTLYDTLFSILREQGCFKAFAGITLPNPASVGLHERMGFAPAAIFRGVGYKFDKWLDVGWWQLDLQPEHPNPPEPRPFREIRESASVAALLAEGQRRLARELCGPRYNQKASRGEKKGKKEKGKEKKRERRKKKKKKREKKREEKKKRKKEIRKKKEKREKERRERKRERRNEKREKEKKEERGTKRRIREKREYGTKRESSSKLRRCSPSETQSVLPSIDAKRLERATRGGAKH